MKYCIDPELCKGESCGRCLEVCDYGAIELDATSAEVALEAGAHTVRFHYRDRSVRAGLTLSVLGVILVVVSLLFGVSVASIVTLMAGTWVPVVILATLLMRTRSLALTLQVTVIVAVVALAGFYVVVADPVAFWQPTLAAMDEFARQSGLAVNTELLNAEAEIVDVVGWRLDDVVELIRGPGGSTYCVGSITSVPSPGSHGSTPGFAPTISS